MNQIVVYLQGKKKPSNSPRFQKQSYVQHQPGQNPNNNVQLQNQVPNTTLPHQAQNQTSTNSPYQQGHARNFYQQQPTQEQINNQPNNAGQLNFSNICAKK